jgi:hypothetical protein
MGSPAALAPNAALGARLACSVAKQSNSEWTQRRRRRTDDGGCGCQRLEFAQVCTKATMRALGEKKCKHKSSLATSTDRMRRSWKGFSDTSRSRGSRSTVRPRRRRTRRLDVHTAAKGTEARQIRFATRIEFVRNIDLVTVNGHVVKMIKLIRSKARGQ